MYTFNNIIHKYNLQNTHFSEPLQRASNSVVNLDQPDVTEAPGSDWATQQ